MSPRSAYLLLAPRTKQPPAEFCRIDLEVESKISMEKIFWSALIKKLLVVYQCLGVLHLKGHRF